MPPQNTNQTEQNSQVPPVSISPVKSKLKWVIVILVLLLVILGYFLSNQNKAMPNVQKEVAVKLFTDLCSTYFGICIDNADEKWKSAIDGRSDFSVVNSEEGVTVAFAYSTGMEFIDTDPGFTTVNLLGQTKQAYKDVKDGLTRVLTGTTYNNASLIIIMASDKDITVTQIQSIITKVKIKTK